MKVKYIGASTKQVNWGGNDDPRGLLTQDVVYEVARKEVHSWHTKIELTKFPERWFNDASFEYVYEDSNHG